MRVTCIMHGLGGGAAKSLHILLSHLSPDVQAYVLSHWYSEPNAFSESGMAIERIRSNPLPLHLVAVGGTSVRAYCAWLAKSLYFPETLSKVAHSRPDIVLLNGYTGVCYAPFAASFAKVVLYAREMLEHSAMDAKLVKAIVSRYVHHVICISENEQAQFGDVRCPSSVIYNSNGFSIPISPPISGEMETRQEVRVGVFGQIYEAKGQFFLLEAIQKHRAALEQAHVVFTIYGAVPTSEAGRDLQRLLSSPSNESWRHMVRFAGWVDDVQSAMRDVDIVLRPDLTGSPWGRDIVEAMSNGRPVVATGSSQVFVKPGTTGELFSPGDAEAMVQHITALARDRGRRLRYGENALVFARQNFDPALNARRVMAIFEALTGQAQPSLSKSNSPGARCY